MRVKWYLSSLLCATLLQIVAIAAPRPNVLLIAIDDLRTEIGCYGASHVKTPHIDRLAQQGMLFERAYCQQAVCNPSRTSLMTGLRPDTIEVTGNHVHFRDKHPSVVTLSQHFINHGYHAQSIGKIYHGVFPDGTSKTAWDTMGDPLSWSVPTTRFGPRCYFTEQGIRQARKAFLAMYRPENPGPDDWQQKLVFGPMTESPDVPDNALYDGKVADAAIASLQVLARNPAQPFLLAVGFIKPHTPFVAPRKYFDLYGPRDFALAANPAWPTATPRIAGHGSQEVRRYTDQPKQGPLTADNQRRLKHAYYACTSFVDAQIGRVLAELKRQHLNDNTIVVLFSDHGWHLGEHGLWGKTTNFELDTRVPLIASAPGRQARGQRTRALTELVDLYPTLAELADLPIPAELEGTSFAPVLDDPSATVKTAAFSQFPRGGNADLGGRTMGYSLRTDRWRYTEWIERASGRVIASELYDHHCDPAETVNLAGVATQAAQVAELSRRLEGGRGWQAGQGRAGSAVPTPATRP
jgi:arylsulfatase A-like enzyme